MVPLEAWLLGGSAAAFAGSLWLIGGRRTRRPHGFLALADAEGWDHREAPPEGVPAELAALMGVTPEAPAELYLAGRSAVGPFQLLRFGGAGRATKGSTHACWTFVHLRMAHASPGVWVRPAPRFSPQIRGPRPSRDISRRLRIDGDDEEACAHLATDRSLELLLRPSVPVRLAWQGHDLVVAFPVGVSSPRGVLMLLRYAEAVARAADGAASQPLASPSRGAAARSGAATA